MDGGLTRYRAVRVTKSDIDDLLNTPLLINHLTVESSTEPQWTGLLTVKGDPIFKYPRPIGFGRDSEW